MNRRVAISQVAFMNQTYPPWMALPDANDMAKYFAPELLESLRSEAKRIEGGEAIYPTAFIAALCDMIAVLERRIEELEADLEQAKEQK